MIKRKGATRFLSIFSTKAVDNESGFSRSNGPQKRGFANRYSDCFAAPSTCTRWSAQPLSSSFIADLASRNFETSLA
jgi:hypothetical protein